MASPQENPKLFRFACILVVTLGVTLFALALFILGAGHKNLFRPIGRPRIFFPIISSAFMLAALVAGLTFALAELFDIDDPKGSRQEIAFWGSLLGIWIFWAIILYVYTRRTPRYQTIYRLGHIVFAGSIAELLACVPSHIFVTRRGGCFAGMATSIGLLAGLLVMVWSFGPAIFLLFLREAYRGQRGREKADAVPSRTVPARIQFRLRTLLFSLFVIAAICSFVRAFWGHWPNAVLAAWAVLLLGMPPLVARPRIMWVVFPIVFLGLAYVCLEDWRELALLAIPTGLFGLILLKLVLAGPVPRPITRSEGDVSVEPEEFNAKQIDK